MSVPPPAPNPDSMGLVSKLSTWLGTILNDIMRMLADPEGGQLMLAEQGWGAGAPVLSAALLGRLDQESQAGTDPSIQAEESFAEVLIALAAFIEALENVPDAQASLVTAASLAIACYIQPASRQPSMIARGALPPPRAPPTGGLRQLPCRHDQRRSYRSGWAVGRPGRLRGGRRPAHHGREARRPAAPAG